MSHIISRIRGAFSVRQTTATSSAEEPPSRLAATVKKSKKTPLFLTSLLALSQTGMSLPQLTPASISGQIGTQINTAPLEYGRVGVVGDLFAGGDLSCGGTYQPSENVVFHPSLPCGSKVKVYNPATNLQAIATVVNQAVMFRKGQGRVADISPATAKAVGVDANAPRAHALIVQQLGGNLQNVVTAIPSLPTLAAAPNVGSDTLTVLTRNLVAECGGCGDLGMLAVAKVTLNRAEMRFMGASSIRQVVYQPYQFSWVKSGKVPGPSHGSWSEAKELAEATLTDQVSGEGLGLFYRMGWNADHFYATRISSPSWAGRMKRIAFSREMESARLQHRYYASGKYESGAVQIASN